MDIKKLELANNLTERINHCAAALIKATQIHENGDLWLHILNNPDGSVG